jgi:predicted HicB family RNase H-like nuclease
MPKKTNPAESRARLSVQVPASLRAAMKAAATSDSRSLSSWIVKALSVAVAKGAR